MPNPDLAKFVKPGADALQPVYLDMYSMDHPHFRDWNMPAAGIGDSVVLCSSPSRNSPQSDLAAGIVLRNNGRSLAVLVIQKDGPMGVVEKCHHIDDPLLTHPMQGPQIMQDNSYCWMESRTTERLLDLEYKIAELAEALTAPGVESPTLEETPAVSS